MKLRAPFPSKGMNISAPDINQPPLTTKLGKNVRLRDPIDGRLCGSRRAGMSRFIAASVDGTGTHKVQDGISLNIDNKNLTYTAYGIGSEVSVWSATLPSASASYQVCCDSRGNGYWTDPPNGVVKLNQDKRQVWRISPGVADTAHEIRAVFVDDTDWVFCGVSTGGKQATSRLFGFQQQVDDKCVVIWTIELGLYVQRIRSHNGALYILCQDTALNAAYVYVYSAPNTAAPILSRSFRVPYPANDFDISRKSAAVFTTHEPLSLRYTDPASNIATSWWEDWNPAKLANFDKRLWAWLSADDVDADGSMNSGYSDGDQVTTWSDKSPNARNLYRNLQASTTSEFGPKMAKKSFGGKDTLAFNGSNMSMCSDPNVVAASTSSTHLDRAGQRTLIPTYEGAQFVLVMGLKCNAEEAIQVILGQDVSAGHADATFRGLITNSRAGANPGDLATQTTRPGSIRWQEPGGNAHGPSGFPLEGFQGGDGACVVTIVNGGGFSPSYFRVNGRPIDTWTGKNIFKGSDPTFLGWAEGISAGTVQKRFAGLMMEILVLSDWYVQGSNPLAYPTRQTPITVPTWVSPATDWDSNLANISEIEMLEGWMGHRWGFSHKFPIGTFNALRFQGTGAATTAEPQDGNAITIGSFTYTFRNALAGSGDVLRSVAGGAGSVQSTWECARNLMNAINGTGVPGTQYFAGTPSSTEVIAVGIVDYEDNSGHGTPFDTCAIGITSRSTSNTRISCTIAGGAGGGTVPVWDEVSTYASSSRTNTIGDTNYNINQWPHRYYLTKVATAGTAAAGTLTGSPGGPPREDGGTNTSNYQNLSSRYGMVCKWSPVNARLVWCATSNDNLDGVARGAIGYGVSCSSQGLVYCVGPRDTFGVSNIDIRALVDKKDAYSEAAGDGAWTVAQAGATTWNRPRMDVDRNDNLYIPYHCSEMDEGAFVYTLAGVKLNGIKTTNFTLAYSIAHIPNYADWGDDLSGTAQATASRAEFCYIAGRIENEATLTWSANPIAGADESISMSAYLPGAIVVTQEVATFKNPLVAGNGNTLIEATLAGTLSNLQALLNGGAGAGVKYDDFAGGKSSLVRGVNLTANSLTFRALNPIQGPPNFFNYYQVNIDNSGGTPVWSGRTAVGVNNYLSTLTNTAYKVSLVHGVQTTGSPRRMVTLAVCNNTIYWNNAGAWTAVSGGTFTQASQYIQSTSLFQKVYFSNGDQILVVDCKPLVPVASPMASSNSGPAPVRSKLIETYRARIVTARTPDDVHNWLMSAVGDPTNYDTSPPVASPTQAVKGSDSLAGKIPDLINCIAVFNDDLLYFGCDSSIHRLTGDPMDGGQIDLVTNSVGMAFGRSYCFDDMGVMYFVGSRGGFYRMLPNGKPEEIYNSQMGTVLNEIDLANYYVRALWNDLDNAVHIYLMPFGAGGTQVIHFAWEKPVQGFWEDTFGTVSSTKVQPTSMWVSDGDASDDRTILIGCEDGVVRKWDANAVSDDATLLAAIDSQVIYGPYRLDEGMQARLTCIQTYLKKSQQGATVSTFASDTPDDMGNQVTSFFAPPGMGPWQHMRARGGFFWVVISSANPYTRWAYEGMVLDAVPAGRVRLNG